MKAKKILFITGEMTPFVPENPKSIKGRYMPQYIQELGHEIRTFTPKWGIINERRNQLHEVIRLSGMNLIIDDTDHPLIIKVASLQSARMQVYFIENDDYFHNRLMITDENGKEYDDNDERTIFFNLGVIEAVKKAYDSDDTIVRLYDAFDRREKVKLTFGFEPKAVYLCDMLENELSELAIEGNEVTLSLKNFEIVTLKIKA